MRALVATVAVWSMAGSLGAARAAQTYTAVLPGVQHLDGKALGPSDLRGPVITLFWRADCGPCLLELSDLRALKAAARPAKLVPIGLQPSGALRLALRRLGLSDVDSFRTTDDPARVLTRLGGAPPRLPLSVAFRPNATVCGRHTGLLGRDQARVWARSCGDADARR